MSIASPRPPAQQGMRSHKHLIDPSRLWRQCHSCDGIGSVDDETCATCEGRKTLGDAQAKPDLETIRRSDGQWLFRYIPDPDGQWTGVWGTEIETLAVARALIAIETRRRAEDAAA